VFDDVTLDIILHELDTVTDLVAYLRCKENFVCAGKLALAAGEENLLACYVSDVNPDGRHDIVLPAGYKQLLGSVDIWMVCSCRK
jgi:hypothetical protein